ncbi:MAG: hypothetical protein QXU81_10985 [Candidatus Bathyarchaeia archaeon]
MLLGRIFGGLEDLVGDLPLTHRALLFELFFRGTREISWNGESCVLTTIFLKYYESKEVVDFGNI